METAVCSMCLDSDMLCKACQEKVDSGKVSKLEVKLSREIQKLSKKAKSLDGIEILKAVETQTHMIVIVQKGQAPRLVGKQGIIAKQLGEALGKKIRVLEYSKDLRTLIQNLIYPVPLLGLNVVYGKKRDITLVKVKKKARLPIEKPALQEIVKTISGKEIEIEGQS